MQVSTDVNESQINLVREGMDVSIRIDALGEQVFRGVVTKVNKYAEAGSWWSSSAKSYKTNIRIVDPPPQIRSGLTAEVRIHVEMNQNALKLPVQAVMEHKKRTFCLVKQDNVYQTRPVIIASTNDKFIAIDESAENAPKEDEQVVLNPRNYPDLFDFTGFEFDEEVMGPPNGGPMAVSEQGGPGQSAQSRPGGRGRPNGLAGRGRPGGAGQASRGPGGAGPRGQGGRPGSPGSGRPAGMRPGQKPNVTAGSPGASAEKVGRPSNAGAENKSRPSDSSADRPRTSATGDAAESRDSSS